MKEYDVTDIFDVSVVFSSDAIGDTAHTETICHDQYELLYIISGAGRYISEGIELPISAGVLFISRPFEYRALEFDKGAVYTRYSVRFLPTSLSEAAREMLNQIFDSEGGVYYKSDIVPKTVASVFDRFAIGEELPERERRAYFGTLISEIVILLSAVTDNSALGSDENLASKVSRYINSNINRDLSLESLARRFFVNKYYLCRTFKKQSGSSIHSYINLKRVLYAKQLIESGEAAARAAERVGFGDYSAFYRAYIKFYGISPTSSENKRGV